MVCIPCGRGFAEGAVPPNHHALCSEGLLCPNCTALRGLLAACLAAAERIDYALSACTDDDVIDDLGPVADRLRAAIAAARPAGPTRGKE
jgi:CelD/BcsL family acetyltransferase involved in cellulose biosynthesis